MIANDEYKIDDADLECIDKIIAIADSSGLSRWSVDDYRNEIGRRDTVFRKCSNMSGDLVGFIVGRKVPAATDKNGYDAEIYNIAVASGSRRQGVGSAILKDFLSTCVRNGVNMIWLEVRLSNETAIGFYKRSGFAAIDIRRAFYSDPVEDAIVMNRIL